MRSRALSLFAGLAPSVLARLAGAMRERASAAGELLCGRGDAGDRLFVVLAGRLRVSVLTSEGRELSMRIAGPGEMVGEIAVFDGGVRTTAYDGDRASACVGPPCGGVFQSPRAASGDCPQRAENAVPTGARHYRAGSSSIALYPIEQRLARLLLLSIDGAEATPGRRVAVTLNLSQTEIAQLLGATRSKVNVALGKLEEAGALRRTSDRLFCDRDKLMQMAEAAHAREAET